MAEAVKRAKNKSFFAKIAKYLREVRAETKKVIWPNRKQIINNTAVVILSIIIVGAVIWILDLVFGGLVNWLIR